jgi:hypothetical protein
MPAVPGMEAWGNLIGDELNGALDIISRQRPDITKICELNIADNKLPSPCPEGVVRLVIFYEIVQDPTGAYEDVFEVCYPPPYIG